MKVALGLGMLLAMGPGVASAQSPKPPASKPPPARPRVPSPFEKAIIQEAIARQSGEVDPAPEGKVIESIEVVSFDVIEARDPVPPWLNKLHRTSRGYVIEREILLKVGDPYRQQLVDESARNLRAQPQLSVGACVPLRSSTPGKVRLLVVSKDIWSLRPGADAVVSNGGVEKVNVTPAEFNVAGLWHSAALRYEALPESFSIGARYYIPRVWGSRIYASLEWNLLVNQRRGKPEGSYGYASVGQPLFSSITPWSVVGNASYRKEITRRYVNARFSTFDAESTPQDDRLPFAYRTFTYSANALVTRSYGWGFKHDVSFGAEISSRAYSLPRLTDFDPRAVEEFRQTKVPQSDRRVGPILSYRAYTSDFLTLLDYDTLGLQEDVRVGHDASLRLYPVSRLFGASRNYAGMQIGAAYTVPLADGFSRVSVGSTTESSGRKLTDASFDAQATIVTPRLGFGRLIFSVATTQRYRNFRNETTFLGGDTTLRGYPSSFFVGKDVVVYNVEFRSRPVEVLSSQLGIALFHDVGDAYDGLSDLRLRRSVGLGLRALFPQLNRMVLRADLGVPLSLDDLPSTVPPIGFFISFGQAFKIPS